MNIVVLDGGTTNPGDLSWSGLAALGEVTVYGDTAPEEVLPRAAHADALVVNLVALTGKVLKCFPRLSYVGTLSTGYNTIDLAFCKARRIPVCNVPDYCVKTVAQWAFSLLLTLCSHVEAYNALVKNGQWDKSVALSFGAHSALELSGKTLGILGYGNIGRAVGDLSKALGMEIIAHSPRKKPGDVEFVSLEALFQRSDVLSIHCALTPETRELVNLERLKKMKPTALILNTARGGVIVEKDLAFALNSGLIAGAGLDVLTREPPEENNPLLTAKNCLLTP
ncbi:MAG: D-2-hydroxyacid dehydrogenase, partial [Oscillospiraceae bacterium]